MPSEQMQALLAALRDHIPDTGTLTVEQHRAMHDGLLARRPPDEGVRVESATLGGVAAEWVWAEGVPAGRVVLHLHGGGFRAGSHAFPATAPETPEAKAAIGRIADHLMTH
jgi:epsilon-lactone hydrolase